MIANGNEMKESAESALQTVAFLEIQIWEQDFENSKSNELHTQMNESKSATVS